MTVLELMDAVLNDDEVNVEIYSVEIEDTVWNGKYDGVQSRNCIPKKYWEEDVDTFQFDKNYLCINY